VTKTTALALHGFVMARTARFGIRDLRLERKSAT
jgi:hypothetical protein